MSSYLAVNVVTAALRRLLWSEFDNDVALRAIVGSESSITFTNPAETGRDPANRLSLWLHQVTENEFLKNAPPEAAVGADRLRTPPLALDLHYLLTPFAQSGAADHLLLGKAMQVFYDHAVVAVREPEDDVAEELHIVLCRLNIEELTRIWEALREPYRLSVCYLVRVARIASDRVSPTARVVHASAGFAALDGAT